MQNVVFLTNCRCIQYIIRRGKRKTKKSAKAPFRCLSFKTVNPPRLIRFREYRRGFQTPHGRKFMPATLGRSGYLTTDTAQTQ